MSRAWFALCVALCACAANAGTPPPVAHDGGPSDPNDGPITLDTGLIETGLIETGLIDTGLNEASAACIDNDAAVAVGVDEDWDRDGWAISQGDCNDCDPNANPGAWDVAGNGVDEDCNGTADDEPIECDDAIELSGNDPNDGARAMGLCRFTQQNVSSPEKRTWGVISASWQLADGATTMPYASHGVLTDFGPYMHSQQGTALLAISTGTARRPGDPAWQPVEDSNMGTTCATPTGWPKATPSCPGPQSTSPVANDSASLSLRVRAPTNARALSFRFAFYTAEFPKWVCNQYNDFFVVLLDSKAASPKAQDGNICFDGLGNPISVNSAFLSACTPQVAGGKPFACLLGSEPLVGTGFAASEKEPRGNASTGWLETRVAVEPGEDLGLRFIIWDGGDHLRTSTVLIDGFTWDALPASEPVTIPVDQPK
jgi:hypothetical protein